MRAGAAAAVAVALLGGVGVARADAPGAAAPGAGEAGEDDEIVPDPRARRQASEANLEPVRRREGLAVGIALGGGMQVGFGIEEASALGGSFDIRVGTSASDRLAWFLDLATAGMPREGDTSEVELNQNTVLTLGGQVFALGALWLRAGVGLGRLELRSEQGMDQHGFSGLGLLSGGGIDLLRRGRFALSGELTFVSGVYRTGFVTAAVFQLGATWY